MPQCPASSFWYQVADEVKEILDHEMTQRRIIDTRVYISGFSMGGFGTYDLVNAFPTLFAAALPLNGKGNPDLVASYLHTPFWIFSGDGDASYSDDHSAFEIMKRHGAYARFTTYTGAGHSPMGYEDERIWDWMLAQERRSPHNYEVVMRDGASQFVEPGTRISVEWESPEGDWAFDSWSSEVGASFNHPSSGFIESSGSLPASIADASSSSTHIITTESDSLIGSSQSPGE